ncbi:hypothetical protein ACI77N_30290, partial [Pseudomonas sp. S191]|uniref:hypothetical protein n=1 Tax=Pseudomonas sp. S191 TaxID=579575 RepID=UPI00387B5A7D
QHTLCLMYRDPNVGAGLLAKVVGQLHMSWLTHRIREQVESSRRRSHNLTEFGCQHRSALALDLRRHVKPRWPNTGTPSLIATVSPFTTMALNLTPSSQSL